MQDISCISIDITTQSSPLPTSVLPLGELRLFNTKEHVTEVQCLFSNMRIIPVESTSFAFQCEDTL